MVDYSVVKSDFEAWLRSRKLSEGYVKAMLSYLDRFGSVIRGPMDVVRIFRDLTVGQQHQMIRALRNLLNFYEVQGLACEDWLNLLRKNIPKDQTGIDMNIPSEERVVETLRALNRLNPKFQKHKALYNLVLDSGLRLIEAVTLMNDFNRINTEKHDGFYIATIGQFRRTKLAYYGFFTEYTRELIRQVNEEIGYANARKFIQRRRDVLLHHKYLRKFAFDMMTSEKLNIPESAADFIQGRVPKSVGARHYMKLKRKAMQFYLRYAEYITELRRKALN